MNASSRALWSRIQAFEIDEEDVAFPFTARLARENGWSRNYADRLVQEYKRFLFLMIAAGHPVTPSDEIDQAWHLHLTYTHSYWDRFCGETVGRPLHHGPTRGGYTEQDKFHRWYARTLASYERLFGSPPPADIWPDPDTRFGEHMEFRRVNIRRNWVIPRPGRLARSVAAGLLGVGLWAGFLASRGTEATQPIAAQQLGGGNGNSALAIVLVLAAGMTAIVVVVGCVAGSVRRRRCPHCRTSLSLHRTRTTKRTGGRKQVKWRCSHCSHVVWRRESPNLGGGGCGGYGNVAGGGWFGCAGGGDGGGGCGGGGGGCGGGA